MITRRLAKEGLRKRGPFPLAIEAHEHPRRDAQIIEQDAAEIAQAPREIALAPIARRARHGARGENGNLASLETAHEVDVLHQRDRAEAAEPVIELARDEEAL